MSVAVRYDWPPPPLPPAATLRSGNNVSARVRVQVPGWSRYRSPASGHYQWSARVGQGMSGMAVAPSVLRTCCVITSRSFCAAQLQSVVQVLSADHGADEVVLHLQDFNEAVTDISSREVMEMMLITQYFDMLR
jgi:hypothetical protein